MNNIRRFLLLVGAALIITGCGTSSSSIKQSRGTESAQVTQAEYEQYSKQQNLESREMSLQRQQQTNVTRGINDGVNTVRNIRYLLKGW